MEFILGVSLTLNCISGIAIYLIYKHKSNILNDSAIVDRKTAKEFLKWGVIYEFF